MRYLIILIGFIISFMSAFSHDIEIQKGQKTMILDTSNLVERVIVYSKTDSTKRFSYFYDAMGNMISELSDEWAIDQWLNMNRYTNTYFSNGKINTKIFEIYQSGDWLKSHRYTYSYDSTGNLAKILDQNWKYGEWSNYEQFYFTYDINGRLKNKTLELWGHWEEYDNWYFEPRNRKTYTYDSIGNISVELTEGYVANFINFRNNYEYSYTYDTKRNKLTKVYREWRDNQWSALIDQYRYTNTYDSDGNLLSCSSEYFSIFDWKWIKGNRFTYTYDINGYLINAICENSLKDSWEEADGIYNIIDCKGNDFNYEGYKIEVIWKTITTEVKIINDNIIINISPNPSSDNISISFSNSEFSNQSISIFNSIGVELKKFVEKEINGQSSISFSTEEFPSGIYFCILTNGTKRVTKSFVVVR